MKALFPDQVCQTVPMPASPLPVGSTMSTVHLSSDGTYFYWIWSPASLNEKTPKGHSVFMDIFELVVSFSSFCITAEMFLFAFYIRRACQSQSAIVLSLLSTVFLLHARGGFWVRVLGSVEPRFLKANLRREEVTLLHALQWTVRVGITEISRRAPQTEVSTWEVAIGAMRRHWMSAEDSL